MPLRIAHASAEVAPLAKTGGLGDVAAALSTYLDQRGHDVRLFLPLYRRVREGGWPLEAVPGLERLRFELGPRTYDASIVRTVLPGTSTPVYCVDSPRFFDREGIYTPDPDEHLRFAVFSRAVIAACQESGWAPDVVHCHDWHAALVPLYLRLLSSWDRLFASTKTVLTIHNAGHQGTFSSNIIPDVGLDDAVHLLHQEHLDAGRLSFMVSGLLYADVLTTVSPRHAQELQTEEHGFGLQDLFRARADHLVGILNGIDTESWNPATDPLIPRNYSVENIDDKYENTHVLLREMGLRPANGAPVFGIVSRLAYQKGFELLFDPLPELMSRHDLRLAVLGTGEPKYEEFFARLQHRFPGRACFYRGYSNELAHLIEAGADAFLMPSRYEPCGLNQMYSMAYGTVPIVHATGGLADTVTLHDPQTGEGTGIAFENFDADAMRWALATALDLYRHPPTWRRMMINGMSRDFSWERSVALYEELYRRLLS